MAETDELRSEIARLQRELELAYKDIAIARLAAGVIHEISTPIASIFSNIEVLRKSLDRVEQTAGEKLDSKSRSLLATMRSLLDVDRLACERIAGIVRSLKVHARVEDDRFERVDLKGLIDDSIRLVNAEYKTRIRIVTEYGDVPPVECSPQLLSQVLLNLLTNAAQAIEGEGTITVRTAVEGDSARISVQDTGAGMTESCKAKIFAMGFSTKPVGVGTGLGLAISRKIVEGKHGGTITFESEQGRGTTFHIRIPLQAMAGKEQK